MPLCRWPSDKGHKFPETLVCKVGLTMFKFQGWLWELTRINVQNDFQILYPLACHFRASPQWLSRCILFKETFDFKTDQKFSGCVFKTHLSPRKIIHHYYLGENSTYAYYMDICKHRLFINCDCPDRGVCGWLEIKNREKTYFPLLLFLIMYYV